MTFEDDNHRIEDKLFDVFRFKNITITESQLQSFDNKLFRGAQYINLSFIGSHLLIGKLRVH